MFILTILIPFILLFVIFYKTGSCLRNSFLAASVLWGAILAGITEFLNLFKLVNFQFVFLSWVIVSIILLGVIFWLFKKNLFTSEKKIFKWDLDFYLTIILLAALVYLVATAVTALVAAPSNYDSLSYHMARVMHWIQNQGVFYYPTNIARQIIFAPFAEFIIMHFQILSGTDYFANSVQWMSMFSCLIGVSLIAKHLGADTRGQFFAAILTLSIPMVILQSTSTQNDLVVSFWLVCFVYYLLNLIKPNNDKSLFYTVLTALSLGLALLTKNTAYIFAFPFIIWGFVAIIKKFKTQAYKYLLLLVLIPLVLNAGYYTRNYKLFNSILSYPKMFQSQVNAAFAPQYLFINVLKNICLETNTTSMDFNNKQTLLLKKVAKSLNVDIDDSRTNLGKDNFRIYSWAFFHEDFAPAPILLCLIIISIFIFLLSRKYEKKGDMLNYLIALISGFLLFCFIIRWQMWGSRLHLPIFVLFCPFVSIILSQISQKTFAKLFVNTIILVVLLSGYKYVFDNSNRSLVGFLNIFTRTRTSQYFGWTNQAIDYPKAAEVIKKHHFANVGILMNEFDMEYPLWILLKQDNQNVRIEHVLVTNESKNVKSEYFNSFTPDVIVSTLKKNADKIQCKKRIYKKQFSSKTITLFY